jgi:hypothetical protein
VRCSDIHSFSVLLDEDGGNPFKSRGIAMTGVFPKKGLLHMIEVTASSCVWAVPVLKRKGQSRRKTLVPQPSSISHATHPISRAKPMSTLTTHKHHSTSISIPTSITLLLNTLTSRIQTMRKVLQSSEWDTSYQVIAALERFLCCEPSGIGVGEYFRAVLVRAAESV